MERSEIEELAASLWRAQESGQACAPLSESSELTVEDAYAIQGHTIARRMAGEGLHGRAARKLGHKVGLTSDAIQSWLGVDEPDFGVLLDDMYIEPAGSADIGQLLQPRAEAEIAFILGDDLRGPGCSIVDVIGATAYIVPAIEVIDSRIADWSIKYVDTVADNASSGMFVLGSRPVRLESVPDLRLSGALLRKNGRVVSTGAGAASLGDPLNAVAWLANKLAQMGELLQAGDVVLSGALGPAVDVVAGDWLEAEIAHLGKASMRFESKVDEEQE